MTYNQLWKRLTAIYNEREAQAIVRTVLDALFGMSLTDICLGKVTQLSADDTTRLEKIMQRLEKSEPVQYVLGAEWFAGRLFDVAPGVLIPRPETEDLVKWACDEAKEKEKEDNSKEERGKEEKEVYKKGEVPHPSILDIGTGSGCIAITVALALPQARVTAWDISTDALAIAAGNAHRLGASVRFEHQDALSVSLIHI